MTRLVLLRDSNTSALPHKHIPRPRVREHAGHPSMKLKRVGVNDLKWGCIFGSTSTNLLSYSALRDRLKRQRRGIRVPEKGDQHGHVFTEVSESRTSETAVVTYSPICSSRRRATSVVVYSALENMVITWVRRLEAGNTCRTAPN